MKIACLILATIGLGDVVGHFFGDFAKSVSVVLFATVCAVIYFKRRKQSQHLRHEPLLKDGDDHVA
jgi:hypothetical protein